MEQAAQKENILSHDPTIAMQEMMSTIDAMRDVFTKENTALAAANTKAFLELQEEKLTAARNYQRSVEEILSRQHEMKAVNPILRKRLQVMQTEFAKITHENLDALDRMRRVVGRLGETISKAARDAASKERAFSYGQSGVVEGDARRSVSMGISETA